MRENIKSVYPLFIFLSFFYYSEVQGSKAGFDNGVSIYPLNPLSIHFTTKEKPAFGQQIEKQGERLPLFRHLLAEIAVPFPMPSEEEIPIQVKKLYDANTDSDRYKELVAASGRRSNRLIYKK